MKEKVINNSHRQKSATFKSQYERKRNILILTVLCLYRSLFVGATLISSQAKEFNQGPNARTNQKTICEFTLIILCLKSPVDDD